MSEVASPVASRFVPGAPPQPPVSKSQKKKRKTTKPRSESDSPVAVPDSTSSALLEQAPTPVDVKEGAVAPQLVASDSLQGSQSPMDEFKPSPIVDLINKRLKATSKKITRIQTYLSESPEKLNDDQRRLLKTLPSLEATIKELQEVKKVIETHEAELAQELALKHAEAERIEQERIRQAILSTEESHREKTTNLVSFIRLHSLLSGSHPSTHHLALNEPEGIAIYSATETLLGDDPASRDDVVRGFLSAEGEFDGVPYSRLVEIVQLYHNPPPAPTPVEEPQEEQAEETVPEPIVEPEVAPVGGLPTTAGLSNSFHFMQEDELAAEAQVLTHEEWTEIAAPDAIDGQPDVEIVETVTEVTVNGHTLVQDEITVTTKEIATSGTINWADEEVQGLPSIADVHANFGTSGDATPSVEPVDDASVTVNGAAANGAEDDGFTHARGRGRGRGGRGERGGYRGNFRGGRGGERGDFRGGRGGRGGERGEFRGGRGGEHGEFRGGRGGGERGEFRGGERGGRGGFRGGERGGERGGFRGRSSGDWRSPNVNGDGESRGNGRGRGRGRGFPERGAAPVTPTA